MLYTLKIVFINVGLPNSIVYFIITIILHISCVLAYVCVHACVSMYVQTQRDRNTILERNRTELYHFRAVSIYVLQILYLPNFQNEPL